MNKDIKYTYLVFGAILCASIGAWIGYGFSPKVGPKTIEQETLNYQLPENSDPATVIPERKNINSADSEILCAQVITTAKNPLTGETKDFPTPCDIPAGWTIVENLE